ncbi:MAG: DUF3943 domain-containing protein [Bacteroidales bacterium]|nr:DUF3943 domain-containing protein [Bacteroidales bacterium]
MRHILIIILALGMLLEPVGLRAEKPITIYAEPYSMTGNYPDWHRLWINTAVLGGAFIGAMAVLETLPEGTTKWSTAEIRSESIWKRWYKHVIKEGPEFDGDNAIFNYVLHPYAGGVYFMAARSCGFNFYRSLLYSACISTVCWEFGIEGIMERPSYQDIFITPLVGCVLGEGFYRIKRHIVDNGYELAGSRFLGGFVAWLVDPVNEAVGLFAGNPARKYAGQLRLQAQPVITASSAGFSITATF